MLRLFEWWRLTTARLQLLRDWTTIYIGWHSSNAIHWMTIHRQTLSISILCTADFEIRTVVSLTVRVQRKRVLVYDHGWFRGDRRTPLITHRQLLSTLSAVVIFIILTALVGFQLLFLLYYTFILMIHLFVCIPAVMSVLACI